MEREELYYRLKILLPDVGFIFWPYDESNPAEDKGCASCMHYDGWVIGVYNDPEFQFPSEQQIEAITSQEISDYKEEERKAARNAKYAEDLTVLSGFATAKQNAPDLTFSEYLDELESLSETVLEQL